jgi:hypothetical protein
MEYKNNWCEVAGVRCMQLKSISRRYALGDGVKERTTEKSRGPWSWYIRHETIKIISDNVEGLVGSCADIMRKVSNSKSRCNPHSRDNIRSVDEADHSGSNG